MALYAVIRDSDDEILNIVVWDGIEEWNQPAGTRLLDVSQSLQYHIGGILTPALEYTPPPDPPDPPEIIA